MPERVTLIGDDMKCVPIYRVGLVREGTIKYEAAENCDRIDSVTSVISLLSNELRDLDREKLVCLMLNARNRPIGMEVVSIGILTASLAHPREIFKAAILRGAASIILAHNHPSGDPSPSPEDQRLTKRIGEAGRILGIEMLDHIIVTDEGGNYSFKTSGEL